MAEPEPAPEDESVLLDIILGRAAARTRTNQEEAALAWCERSNLIAAASNRLAGGRRSTEPADDSTDSKDQLRIHIVDPEAPATHAIVRVNSHPSGGCIRQLEWSPHSCSPALLCVQSNGACTILTHPPYRAQTIDAWETATQFSDQEALCLAKWLQPPSPYSWPANSASGSFEERFMASSPASLPRWPQSGFSCLVTVTQSGSTRLHYELFGRDPKTGQVTWTSTDSVPLACGFGGSMAADATVTTAGSVLVALVPASQPSTVVLWELLPANPNPNPHHNPTNPGASSLSPLVTALLQTPPSHDEKHSTPLVASIVSSFSVEEGGAHTRKVAGLAFQGGPGGESLVVVTTGADENDLTSLERWRSTVEPLEVHEVFRGLQDGKEGQESVVTWSKSASVALRVGDDVSKIGLRFSSTGDQLAVRTVERTHLFHVRSDFALEALPTPHLATPVAVFSPTGCCVAGMFPGGAANRGLVSVGIVAACPWDGREKSPGDQKTTEGWDLALTQRCLWGFVSLRFAWDIVLVARNGPGSITGLGGYLDVQLHALPGDRHRRHYAMKLDRLKTRLLANAVGENRLVSLEARIRLVLECVYQAMVLLVTRPAATEPGREADESLAELEGWCQDSAFDIASLVIKLFNRSVDTCVAHQAAPAVHTNFPGLPGTRLVGDRGFLRRLLEATGGAQRLRFMREKREKAPGDLALRKSGQGNAGAGYSVQEITALYTVIGDLTKRAIALPAKFPPTPPHPTTMALHYAEGWSSIGWEEVHRAIQAVGNALPRPPGADSVGIMLRTLDVLVSWELPTDEQGPGLDDPPSEQSYLAKMGYLTPGDAAREAGRKRRRAENAAASGRGTPGAMRAIVGSRRDTLDFRWKAAGTRGGVWCGGCGKSTFCFQVDDAVEGGRDRAQKWNSSWGAKWATKCPLCLGSWHAAL